MLSKGKSSTEANNLSNKMEETGQNNSWRNSIYLMQLHEGWICYFTPLGPEKDFCDLSLHSLK